MKTHQYKVLRTCKEFCDTIIDYCDRWESCEDCVLYGFLEDYDEGTICPVSMAAEFSYELDLPLCAEEEKRALARNTKRKDACFYGKCK